MAIKFSESVRNARLNAIETTGGTSCSLEIRSGTVPTSCATAPPDGAVLATMDLPTPSWMADAASGVKGLSGTWQDTSADAATTTTATYFRIYSSQSTKNQTTCIIQGTVSATGGGGDLTLSSASISPGQTVTITQFDLTDGNS